MGGAAKQQQRGKKKEEVSTAEVSKQGHHGSCMGRPTTWVFGGKKGWASAEEKASVWGRGGETRGKRERKKEGKKETKISVYTNSNN